MKTNETSGQEPGGRTDLEVTVCANGVVNVHRPESDRAHSVFLGSSGGVARCSCRGYRFHGHCAHADEIAARPLVTASARAAASARIATDGGHETDTRCEDCGARFDGHDDPTCPECGGHGYPVRSEAPDMGGGESTGPELL